MCGIDWDATRVGPICRAPLMAWKPHSGNSQEMQWENMAEKKCVCPCELGWLSRDLSFHLCIHNTWQRLLTAPNCLLSKLSRFAVWQTTIRIILWEYLPKTQSDFHKKRVKSINLRESYIFMIFILTIHLCSFSCLTFLSRMYRFPWASQVVLWQRICLPMQEMQETWIQSLGWKISWSRKWQPTPVFLPGKFHGLRNLAGYSLWGWKESDMTEHTYTDFLNIGPYIFKAITVLLWGELLFTIMNEIPNEII